VISTPLNSPEDYGRKYIFTGRYGSRERKAFKEFLMKHLKDKLPVINEKIAEMTFEDKDNLRTSKILQKIFVEVYEFYIKGDEELEKELFKMLRITRYKRKISETLSDIVFNLKEALKGDKIWK
jgi:hypothetical protein